jgi:Mg2+ and Co2+ transporter CorA
MTNHLQSVQEDIVDVKLRALQKSTELKGKLSKARDTIKLMEDQMKGLETSLEDFRKQKEVWRDDRAFADEVAQKVRDAERDFELVIERALMYKNLLEITRQDMAAQDETYADTADEMDSE